MKSLRQRVWEILEGTLENDRPAQILGIFISLLIILNVLAVSFATVDSLASRYQTFFFGFEIFSVIIFSIEYIARIWSCASDERYSGAIIGRLRFAFRWMPLIDLFSVLPFYLPFFGLDMRSVRLVRLFRLTRMAKLGRYSSSAKLIADVFRAKKEELLLSMTIVLVLLFFSSTAIYYCEREAQPEQFSSIPGSTWWAVATLTTIGYGDAYPVTMAGKIFAAMVSILGIGVFALPTGILGAGFLESIEARKKDALVCPNCGKKIDSPNTKKISSNKLD
jgi:voltage-gated potassium channel